ncbi:uncharacterized protein LOC125493582 [Beta vulgaris subsp. vulgaris]|uniref:uncharacterized protein LOC125493582 n=1 Tax=Beta vulgaris subsp. vulgaris TaxID=3555 RepID=UPI002036CDCE|nr:uncharacterized protein LOC125493582 [Beta vulgaris subsp. vulgaris]
MQEVITTDIDTALASIDDAKAAGLDEFNAIFFKKTWHLIKHDIYDVVLEFFDQAYIHKPVNCITITLIPKLDNALYAKGYRPIAWFIPGRQIVDNILLATELIRGYNRSHMSPRCVIKVDTKKAYDLVQWVFLESMLKELGFPERCLSDMSKNPDLNYHPKCERISLTHLMFADDLLMFARADHSSIEKIVAAFHKFSRASGLEASNEKSCIYFSGVHQDVATQLAEVAIDENNTG